MTTQTAQTLTDAQMEQDVRLCVREYRTAQRFSTTRDSFVVLRVRHGNYQLSDDRSEKSYSLAREYTDESRLLAHWRGFVATHAANL